MATNTPEEKKLLTFLDQLDDEAKANQTAAVGDGKWDQCLQIFRGKQTVPINNPYFQANIVGTEVERKAATLSENKPELRIMPRRDGVHATAQILQQYIRADWDEQNVSDALEMGCLHMGIFGSTIFGIQWNRNANYGLGALEIYAIDPRSFRIDPSVIYPKDIDKAQYLIVDSLEPLADIRRDYPGKGSAVPSDPRSSLYPAGKTPSKRGIVRAAMEVLRSRGGQDAASAGPLPRGYIREYWFKDPNVDDKGYLFFPSGRQVIRGGNDVILHDGTNPYFDGRWPFEMCNGKVDPDHVWGRSEVEGLRRLQEAVNRLGHIFVDGTVRSGNPKVIMDNDAIDTDQANKLSNIGSLIIRKRFGRELQYHPPGDMPSHFLDFIKFAMYLVDVLTGMADSTQARGRTEVRSGAMLEGLQTQAQVLVRQQARRLEEMLERLGQKWISRVFQFATDDRLMSMLESQTFVEYQFERQKLLTELVQEAGILANKKLDEEREKAGILYEEPPKQYKDAVLKDEIVRCLKVAWRDYRFKVTPGSSLSSTKTQRAMLFGELAKNGLASPKRVLRELGVDNVDEELKEAMEFAQQRQAAGLPMPGAKEGKKPKA